MKIIGSDFDGTITTNKVILPELENKLNNLEMLVTSLLS